MIIVGEKSTKKSKFPPCSLCKEQIALWHCTVFKEKTATQRAKYVAEQMLCSACLQSNHSFPKCPKTRKCTKSYCESTHIELLHGAEKVFPPREDEEDSSSKKETMIKNVFTHAAVGDDY